MRVYACRGMMEVSRWSNERSACGSALCCCRCCCCCCCCCATIGPRSICTCGFVPRLASISRGHRPHDLVGLAILSIIWQSAASSTPRLPLLTASPRAKRLASPPLASIISVAITPDWRSLAITSLPTRAFLPPLLARPRSDDSSDRIFLHLNPLMMEETRERKKRRGEEMMRGGRRQVRARYTLLPVKQTGEARSLANRRSLPSPV